MKAIFLDRDGVIINNSNHYYIFQIEDVIFVDGIFENLRQIKDKGYELFVVSNQGGISKKKYSKKEVEQVHFFIREKFKNHSINFLEIAYCPHHDSIEQCFCRKPSALMIEKLIARYNIDVNNSFLIGDSPRDIEAAKRAGIEGILIPSNQNMSSYIQKILQA